MKKIQKILHLLLKNKNKKNYKILKPNFGFKIILY